MSLRIRFVLLDACYGSLDFLTGNLLLFGESRSQEGNIFANNP
jgi:hypothetical protein